MDWARLVAAFVALWESVKPYGIGYGFRDLLERALAWRRAAKQERAARDELQKNIQEFDAFKSDPGGNAEWLRERAARKP